MAYGLNSDPAFEQFKHPSLEITIILQYHCSWTISGKLSLSMCGNITYELLGYHDNQLQVGE